jgi:hypothetical protein
LLVVVLDLFVRWLVLQLVRAAGGGGWRRMLAMFERWRRISLLVAALGSLASASVTWREVFKPYTN